MSPHIDNTTIRLQLPEPILAETPGPQTELGEAEGVSAADGAKLVFAVVRADDPLCEPADAQLSTETTTAVRVAGNEVSGLPLSLSAGGQGAVVLLRSGSAAGHRISLTRQAGGVGRSSPVCWPR